MPKNIAAPKVPASGYVNRSGQDIAGKYGGILADYAVKEDWKQVEDRDLTDNRSIFQRDRDRIIHSQAFRRLMYKTQVFVNHESDHFRTRLTHTLEVSQLARGVCKSLGLNEDLAEAVALGHDLGHTPFGHAVEGLFDQLLKKRDMGRFYHNEQSVRVVTLLENRTHDKIGLGLSKDVREGILKHNKDDRSGVFSELHPYEVCSHLEGQIVQIVDTIAYTCHDFEDAIKAGIVNKSSKKNLDFKNKLEEAIGIIKTIINNDEIPISYDEHVNTFFTRELIHQLIKDLTNNTLKNITDSGICEQKDIEKHGQLATLSESLEKQFKKLKKFIYNNIYNSQTVAMMDDKAVDVIEYMFEKYTGNPHLLPPEWLYRYNNVSLIPSIEPYKSDDSGIINNEIRVIIDYISCMTDRFALDEHERLSNPRIKL